MGTKRIMGPHSVIWIPTKAVPDVAEWLKANEIEPHPGWIIIKDQYQDGAYIHEKIVQ